MSRHPSLVQLVNVIESRFARTDPPPEAASSSSLNELVPEAGTFVLVMFDGLGAHQLDHARAFELRRSLVTTIAAPFPTTTTVSLATVATGLPPHLHGVLGHLLWIEGLERVVNTLKWVTPQGEHVDFDTTRLLPHPNLWERLEAAGVECHTVQPAGFAETPLTRALYRGCRFHGVHTEEDLVETTTTLARESGRLVFTYLAHVDFAAHVFGQDSAEYAAALATVNEAWAVLRYRLPDGAALLGTADHGHLDYRTEDKLLIRDQRYSELTFYGDSRALMVKGDRELIQRLAGDTGATLMMDADLDALIGDIAEPFRGRRPDAVLLAPPGSLLLPRGFDKRLTGYHGGLHPAEVEIPLLAG